MRSLNNMKQIRAEYVFPDGSTEVAFVLFGGTLQFVDFARLEYTARGKGCKQVEFSNEDGVFLAMDVKQEEEA
jgi:hypothetical protein